MHSQSLKTGARAASQGDEVDQQTISEFWYGKTTHHDYVCAFVMPVDQSPQCLQHGWLFHQLRVHHVTDVTEEVGHERSGEKVGLLS